jgi:hypothetical protein
MLKHVTARARFALMAIIAATLIAAPANAAKFYVSNQLGPVKAEERIAVATPQSVQLLLDFQTDGVTNAKAVKEVKPLVLKYLEGTKLFSAFTDAPAPNGALLVVRFNNIVDHSAAGKGFKAGLTLGLAGTAVTDNYDVTFELSPAAGQPPLKSSLKHALTTTIGKKSDPSYGTEYAKAKEAVDAMVGQAVEHGVFALAVQDGFPGK